MEIFIWIVCSIVCIVGIFVAFHYKGNGFDFNFDDIGDTAGKAFAAIIIGFVLGTFVMLAWPFFLGIFVLLGIALGIAFGLKWAFKRNS